MARSAIFALVIGFFGLNAPEALALAADHPKDILAMQGPNCVHGYFVNSTDMFFFAGDTAAFNKFVDGYSKRQDLKLRLVIHGGTRKARSPWDKADRDIPVDWSFYFWNAGTPDPSNPVPSQVDVWLGGRINKDELRIPANVEVVSGGAIKKASGQDKAEAAKKELAALQGTWKLQTHEEQGKLLPHDDTQLVTIAEDKITWEQHGAVVLEGTLELEAPRTPKHLNYQFTSGRSDQVIYIQVGDYLIQCGRRDGKTRPSEFATATANGGEYLIVLKRVK